MNNLSDDKIVDFLKNGKIGVIPTDTIYGIVGSALIPNTIEKIYQLRKRATNKPFIILISSINDLNHFNIMLTYKQRKLLEKNWPNPLSVVLSCEDGKFVYLHRRTKTLAFRMPKDEKLLELLGETGPLVAPSANFAGEKPAENIEEAKKYFGDEVDFYIDGGIIKSTPSTLIRLTDNGFYQILRQGSYKLPS